MGNSDTSANVSPSPPGAWTQSNGNWTWVPGATPDPTLVQQYGSAALTNPTQSPAGGLGTGSWYQTPSAWKWVPGAQPDPNLIPMYGAGALTDSHQPPSGSIDLGSMSASGVGSGAWVPVSWSGTWTWQWGLSPDPEIDPGNNSNSVLTNPDQSPSGAQGPGNPNSQNYPAENDVVPPVIADIWNGVAPDLTGVMPPLPSAPGANADADGLTPPAPPSHPAYLVSPGSVRLAENTLLEMLDAQVTSYNNLKSAVEQAPSQQIYSSYMPQSVLGPIMDNALLAIADTVTLAGQLDAICNFCMQNYVLADKNSFFRSAVQLTGLPGPARV
jgi:hypothetical protein